MLRLRSHGSRGLAVRLTAAGGLVAALAAVAATTVSAGLLPNLNLPANITVPGVIHVGSPSSTSPSPSSAAGLNLNLGGLTLGLLPSPSIPVISLPPVLPTAAPPTLPPVTGCIVACTPITPPTGGPTPPGQDTNTSGTPGAQTTPGGSLGGGGANTNLSSFPLVVPASNDPSGGASALIPGLHDTPPLPVQTLSAVPGISFGQAPYLWPLFLLLDLVAAVAVVLVVRKTWSRSAAN